MLIVTRKSLPQFAAFMKSLHGAALISSRLEDKDVHFFCPATASTLTLSFDGELCQAICRDQQWMQSISATWNSYRSQQNEVASLENGAGEDEDTGS